MSARLDEAGSNTAIQVEPNKKREAELARIRGELEQLNIAHESKLMNYINQQTKKCF